jgi:hypothetical protein
MTKDRARKQSVRARMAASGEPYSVAARNLADNAEPGNAEPGDAGPGDATALSLLRDRVDATLAAPSARIQFRVETNLATRKDLPAKLTRFFADSILKRIVPGMEISVGGMLGEGIIEPQAGRYQLYWGGRATVVADGRQFFGRPGAPVDARREPDGDDGDDWLLAPLADLRGAVSARFSGEEDVRGTPCQVIIAETGSHEFTVWVDDVHIRRISEKTTATSNLRGTTGRVEETRELWDFGVATEALDWSRFPGPQ